MSETAVQEAIDGPWTHVSESLLRAENEGASELLNELVDGGVLDGCQVGPQAIRHAERAKLLTMGDRLLKHLAGDEGEIDELTAAAKKEVELVTTRYQAVIAQASKRAAWKRFALEQLAAILFPDADAKKKSINLPYGTLGRRDFKGAPELVDEVAAVQRARETARQHVKVVWKGSLEELEDRLVTCFQKVERDSETVRYINGSPATVTTSVREFIDQLIEVGLEGESGFTVKLELAWGALKKEPAVALFALERDGHPGGVKMAGPRTEYFAEVTSA